MLLASVEYAQAAIKNIAKYIQKRTLSQRGITRYHGATDTSAPSKPPCLNLHQT